MNPADDTPEVDLAHGHADLYRYTIWVCPVCKRQCYEGGGVCDRHGENNLVTSIEVGVYVGANLIVAQRAWLARAEALRKRRERGA